MKLLKILTLVFLLGSVLSACKKYLDLKPDQGLYVPSNLTDCQALLDDYSRMNRGLAEAEIASDHFFLTDATWAGLALNEDRDNYVWNPQVRQLLTRWSAPYDAVFSSNLVLEVLAGISPSGTEEYNSVKGSALFFRGFALYNLASIFAKPYDAVSSENDLGVPVRLSPDINIVYGRGTVKKTYDQILEDLKSAADLLPVTSTIKSRPNKIAAYAMLARVYLSMRDYVNAGIYADLCLKLKNTLLNYSSLDATAAIPFLRFNEEVIFSSTMSRPAPLNQTNAKVVKTLYDSYSGNDIRKQIFFRTNTGANAGTFAFKGNYDGATSTLFNGLATDEIFLIRSECYARAGKTQEALKDLNDLLIKRFAVVKDANGNVIKDVNGNPVTTYVPYTANTADEALNVILKEREKELIFRGIRWTDLRRLNKESRFAITLSRTVNGTTYTLLPNDLRYTLLIPQAVINTTGVPQNER